MWPFRKRPPKARVARLFPLLPHIEIMREFDPEWWEASKGDSISQGHKKFCERNGFVYDGTQPPSFLVKQIYERLDEAA